MHDLDYLIGKTFEALDRRGHDWIVIFDRDATMNIACLWRLLEDQRVRFTSEDEEQHFGLPAPVDAAAEVNRRIGGAQIESVDLREGTLDVALHLNTGHRFEIIPDSSGYESWEADLNGTILIAVGGGDLATFGKGG